MSTNLYDTLGVHRSATAEEIRRAYRRKALETHPDRLPQGASAAEKSASEDMFRKVNNAYEVLGDPKSRAAYDEHGVWPPPALAPQGGFANGPRDPFSDPFFSDPFSRNPFFRDPIFRGPRMDPFGFGFGFGPRQGTTGFTDPFVLFDSIFGGLQRAFEVDPFFDDPFNRRGFESNQFNHGFPSMLPSPFDFSGRSMGGSRMQISNNNGNGGRWISENWSSSTVNGVTHTKCVRKDSEGNEHVIYRLPDGTERRTINGIEQSNSPSPRALPPGSYPTQAPSMPPPPYSEAVAHPPHRSHSSRHHVRDDDYSGDRYEHRDKHRHGHSSHDGRDYRDHGQRHDPQGGSAWKFWRP